MILVYLIMRDELSQEALSACSLSMLIGNYVNLTLKVRNPDQLDHDGIKRGKYQLQLLEREIDRREVLYLGSREYSMIQRNKQFFARKRVEGK